MSQLLKQLQNSLLLDDGEIEKVEVNQRHLIDKILARYSAEHTIFRELLQNSNDAQASHIKITFTTTREKEEASVVPGSWLPWSKSTKTCSSITYQNDGHPFSEQDFARLRKIAEGNPDEQKIGFFGVGFYSLFSICEEPFVTSGDKTMGFFWKNDMLYTKRGDLPDEAKSKWTTFYLPGREPIPLPEKDNFARFLATSLAFTTNLKLVEVYVDDKQIISFHRKGAEPELIDDISSFSLSSPQRMFNLKSIGLAKIQLDVEISHATKDNDNFTIFMKVATGNIDVELPRKLIDEMIRTTKKPPPKQTKFLMMYSNYEEYDSTMQTTKNSKDIFKDLVPSPTQQGHVFIGFPTHQQTGSSCQIAGHFIPTVERESIDFADKSLAVWNMELCSMAGIMARICFETETIQISNLLRHMTLDKTSSEWFYQKVAFNLNIFFQRTSTPSYLVGQISQAAFFKCTRLPMTMIASNGKLIPIEQIRLAPSVDMAGFIKSVPTLPPRFAELCPDVIGFYVGQNALQSISIEDVLSAEIATRALDTEELVLFMKWWIQQISNQKITRNQLGKLQNTLIYSQGEKVVPLQGIMHFSSQRIAPKEYPLPDTCLPLDISKNFSPSDLSRCFWGWKELKAIEWVSFIITFNNSQFLVEPSFNESVLGVISRIFMGLSVSDKSALVMTLSQLTCISTNKGMQHPSACYLPNVSLFEDLPKVIYGKGVSESFLKELGVREHVELQLVFDRISDLKWNQTHLIKYLASVQDKLKPGEIESLTKTPLFTKEGTANRRFLSSQLYPPVDKFRQFNLAILNWEGSKWKFMSLEAQLMNRLGLNQFIPLPDFFDILTDVNTSAAKKLLLLKYFSAEPEYEKNYQPDISKSFVPTTAGPVVPPSRCFSDSSALVMGFPVLIETWRPFATKLGIKSLPNGDQIVDRLLQSPPSPEDADKVFTFLAGQQHQLSVKNWELLKKGRFIPAEGRLHSPTTVYLENEHQVSQFTYVSFSPLANQFLKACGVQEQPSPKELAASISADPQAFLQKSPEAFLEILRQIASNWQLIKKDVWLVKKMRESEFLLGLKAVSTSKDTYSTAVPKTYTLARAVDIYLVDDPVLARVFTPLTAPIEQMLETMYYDLGSSWLSGKVTETFSPKGQTKGRDTDFEKIIHDRAALILFDGVQMRNKIDLLPGAQKLLEHIQVVRIERVEIVRVFLGETKKEETTACAGITREGESMLLLTAKFDYFDAAQILAKLVLRKPRLNDSLLISTFLSSSIDNLARKGFPIERILSNAAGPNVGAFAGPIRGDTGSIESLSEPASTVKSTEQQAKEQTSSEDLFGTMKKFGQKLGLVPPVIPSSPNSKKKLEQSISNTRSTRDSRVVTGNESQRPVAPVPRPSTNSCRVVQDLELVSELTPKVVFYVQRGRLESVPMDDIADFVQILEFLAQKVFGINAIVALFYDMEGPTIAFNRGNQLFFNYRYFLLWHAKSGQTRREILIYWFFTFCHELAHNEHGPHDEIHEFWMSSFAEQYVAILFEQL